MMSKWLVMICIPLICFVMAVFVPGVSADDFLTRWAIPICSSASAIVGVVAINKQKNSGSQNTIFWMAVFGLSVLCMLQVALIVLEKPIKLTGSVGTGMFVGVVMLILGNFLQRTKPNAAFGLRLPWTLSNERVWRKSNRFAGRLLMVGGILAICLSFLFTTIVETVILAIVICVAVIAILVSFTYHKQLVKEA